MRIATLLALMPVAAVCIARASVSLSSDLTFATDFVFRGLQEGSNTLHPSVELKYDDTYAGIWAALPIDERASMGWTDRYDFYAGWSPKLSDSVSLDLGGTCYYRVTEKERWEGYAGIIAKWSGLTYTLHGYYDFTREQTTGQGSVGYSIPVDRFRVSVDLSATAGYADPDTVESYWYYGASISVPYKISDNASITVGLHWMANDRDLANVDDSFVYGTAGLTFGF